MSQDSLGQHADPLFRFDRFLVDFRIFLDNSKPQRLKGFHNVRFTNASISMKNDFHKCIPPWCKSLRFF